MKKRKNKWKGYLLQAFAWLLLLQLLNISIDPPGNGKRQQPLSKDRQENQVNQIESLCELVAEEILDTGVPDSDDSDVEEMVDQVVLYCSKPPVPSFAIIQPVLQHQAHYSPSFTCPYTEPPSQPPKNT